MRTVRTRTVIGFCLLVVVLIISGCTFGPKAPSQTPSAPAEWNSATTTLVDSGIKIEKVTYRSGALEIEGQVCRPRSDGPHPVLIANHGGFAGVPDWNKPRGLCALAARRGFVLAESSYRGEDGSEGQVEVCLGEVDDVLAMLKVVRRQSYVDPQRVAMVGISHGGCVTSRAIERGADVDVAVEIAGPTQWNPLMREVKRSAEDPRTNPVLRNQQEHLVETIETAVGGTTAEYPERYAKRSPDVEKIARWGRPFLIMHGAADTIVPVQQSCTMASEIGGFRAYRIDTSGGVVAESPPGCHELTWGSGPNPVQTFNADRYLMVYDEVDHFLVANGGAARMTSDLFRFLQAKLPS